MDIRDISLKTKKKKVKSLYKRERELQQKLNGKTLTNKLHKRRKKNKVARASRRNNR